MFSRIFIPFLTFSIQDGSKEEINYHARELLDWEGSATNIAELLDRGFPTLDFFTQHSVSRRMIHHFPLQCSDGMRDIQIQGSILENDSRNVFLALLEDISSQSAFSDFLLNRSAEGGGRPLGNDELMQTSLGLCHRMLQLKASAAYFPDFQENYQFYPPDADSSLRNTLCQILNTSGKAGDRRATGVRTIDVPGSSDAIIHITSAEGKDIRGTIVLYPESKYDIRTSLFPSLQHLSNLLVEQLTRNSAMTRISLKNQESTRILHNTEVGSILLDSGGKIQDCSQLLCDFLQRKRSEILGLSLDTIPGLTFIPPEQELAREIPVRYSYTRPDGGMMYFNTTEIGSAGGQDRRLLLFSNVSAARRQEDELLLSRNQEAAAQRSKSDFISNISHELRTPLNGINGMAQLLGETALDEEQTDMVETLRQSVAHLNNLIQDLLDFSRLDTGKMTIEEDFFSLDQIIQQVILNHRSEAEMKGLKINFCESKNGPYYFSDAMRFQQIINNFLSNAIKFTDQGSVDISHRIEEDSLSVSVRDTGMGIPEKMQQQIFESFTQLEHTYTKYRQGLGLGLAICQRLSGLMGGHIELESKAGAGTTFSLVLPAAPTTVSYIRPGAEETGNKADSSHQGLFQGLRTLVAEDDFLNRKTLVQFLKKQGCLVTAVKNGLEAEHLLRTMDFDLLIFDITMPELSGQELPQMVRNGTVSANTTVPILGVTAHVFPAELQSFLDSGMSDVLPKPFVAPQLYEKMTRVLEKT